MARPKAPYFPLYARELLTDLKTICLSHDEIGVLLRLWSWMWINDVKRGSLLKESKVPISDEEIAKLLHVSDDQLQKYFVKLVDQEHILKRGRYKELYSKRLRNHKTPYELRSRQKHTKNNSKSNQSHQNSSIREVKRSKEKLREVKKRIKDIPLVELFNSKCPSLQKVEEVTKSRSNKIKTRLKEHPDLRWWSVVFERADKVEFTYTKGVHKGKTWRPSFDWLIENDNNAVKVAEGQYEDKKGSTWREKYGQEPMGKDSPKDS